jgi:hypothetical protein
LTNIIVLSLATSLSNTSNTLTNSISTTSNDLYTTTSNTSNNLTNVIIASLTNSLSNTSNTLTNSISFTSNDLYTSTSNTSNTLTNIIVFSLSNSLSNTSNTLTNSISTTSNDLYTTTSNTSNNLTNIIIASLTDSLSNTSNTLTNSISTTSNDLLYTIQSNLVTNKIIFNNNNAQPIINFQIKASDFIYSNNDNGMYYYILNIENIVKAKLDLNNPNLKCRVFKIFTTAFNDWVSARTLNPTTLTYDCVPDEIQINMNNSKKYNGSNIINDYQVNFEIIGKTFISSYGYWNCIENNDNNQDSKSSTTLEGKFRISKSFHDSDYLGHSQFRPKSPSLKLRKAAESAFDRARKDSKRVKGQTLSPLCTPQR